MPAWPSDQKKRCSRSTNGPFGGRSMSSAASWRAGSSGVRGGTGPVPICPVWTPGVMPKRTAGPPFGTAESWPKHDPC